MPLTFTNSEWLWYDCTNHKSRIFFARVPMTFSEHEFSYIRYCWHINCCCTAYSSARGWQYEDLSPANESRQDVFEHVTLHVRSVYAHSEVATTRTALMKTLVYYTMFVKLWRNKNGKKSFDCTSTTQQKSKVLPTSITFGYSLNVSALCCISAMNIVCLNVVCSATEEKMFVENNSNEITHNVSPETQTPCRIAYAAKILRSDDLEKCNGWEAEFLEGGLCFGVLVRTEHRTSVIRHE